MVNGRSSEVTVATDSSVPEDLVGVRIRRFRLAAGWTLRQLAERTGLSIGFLSQVERGLSSIALSTLREVAAAFDRDIVDFFGDIEDDAVQADDRFFTLSRADDDPQTLVSGGRSYELLSDRGHGPVLEPLLVHIGPGQKREDSYGHEGEEFAYVLEGVLLYTVEGVDHRRDGRRAVGR